MPESKFQPLIVALTNALHATPSANVPRSHNDLAVVLAEFNKSVTLSEDIPF